MQHKRFSQVLFLSLFLNLFGAYISTATGWPVFLDSTGTMLAAVLIGPWVGGLLGLMSNLIKGLLHTSMTIPFGLVSLGIGVVTGYLALYLKDYRRPLAPLLIGTAVAVAAPLLAAPIATYLYGGTTSHGIDRFVIAFIDSGQSILSSAFWGRIPYSFVDKIFSAYLVFFIIKAWPGLAENSFPHSQKVKQHA